MNRKRLCLILLLLLLMIMGCTGSAQPILSGVGAVRASEGSWQVLFESTEGGTLALQARSLQANTVYNLGALSVEAGQGTVAWDGWMADGTHLPDGDYELVLQLQNFWGEQSERMGTLLQLASASAVPTAGETLNQTAEDGAEEVLDLAALEGAEEVLSLDEMLSAEPAAAATALPIEDAAASAAVEAAPKTAAQTDENGIPVATSFWDMNPDAYDLTNPDHQKAIWDLMMQPITVFDVGQTEHVYPTNAPGLNRTPYEQNTAGELHGQSQGIHVLEADTDGDGYVLIEAYSNDGTKTENAYMESIDNKRIQGYVKSSLLLTKNPSTKYALLIDKLRQKLYIFEAGAIIGELEISTGLNNDKQPYNETPAGEFITVSRVGEFVAGTMRAQYAIRINGGTLLHEVPYRYGADGTTKIYSEFEPELGKKASHGCIRIQRRKNAQGQNMQWLWNNLELGTRVFVWDDQGREMFEPELPAASLQLYRNPDGGTNYHLDQNCSGVKSKFLPLSGDLTYGDLTTDAFRKLTPCVYCGAPPRPEMLYERYLAEAKQIGAVIDDAELKKKFGIQ